MSLNDDRTGVEDRQEYVLPGGNSYEFPYPSVSVLEEVFVLDPGSDGVYLMDPDTGDLTTVASNIPDPGTCGDPTGVTNHRSVGAAGTYTHLFEGCPEDQRPTKWSHIVYAAETPAGTSVGFMIRIAESIEQLAAAPAVSVGAAPGDASPIALADAFGGDSPEGNVAELRITLSPGQETVPRLSSVGIGYSCAPLLE
jgi:hypothetical protein